MSEKNCDSRGRWRSITVSFHVSPEENDSINTRVKLSGLTKQEYITKRCQEQDIVVTANPRVYKALKTHMELICVELQRLAGGDSVPESTLETLSIIALMLGDMKGESED